MVEMGRGIDAGATTVTTGGETQRETVDETETETEREIGGRGRGRGRGTEGTGRETGGIETVIGSHGGEIALGPDEHLLHRGLLDR